MKKTIQPRRMSINESGRNSFIQEYPNKSINGNYWQRLNIAREESLQLTEQYRLKFENSRVSYENFQASNPTQTIQFPSRPTIPKELIGKSHENHPTNFLTNSNLNKSDG